MVTIWNVVLAADSGDSGADSGDPGADSTGGNGAEDAQEDVRIVDASKETSMHGMEWFMIGLVASAWEAHRGDSCLS